MRLIDVDALKEYIDGCCFCRDCPKEGRLCECTCELPECVTPQWERVFNEQPTVDAVPARHGKFIGTEYDGYADGYPVYYEWQCSECGCVFEDEEPTYNYCPNCGARMDEE